MTDRLFGRDQQRADLHSALDDPSTAIAVLRGPAGAGKTVLAKACLLEAQKVGAFGGSGKYGEGDIQPPFGPVMRALSGAVGAALDSLYEPEPVAAAMADALGPAAGVLAAAGFEATTTPSTSDRGLAIGRRERSARIIEAALKLVRWLARFDRPIILFIDDWPRGGALARSIILALAGEAVDLRLTLILAERDDQPSDPAMAAAGARVIWVGALNLEDRGALLCAELGGPFGPGFDWTGLGGPGLPFDVIADARALRDGEAVVWEGGAWRVDVVAAARLGLGDAATHLADRLGTLSDDARQVALAAALWGTVAPRRGLARALGLAEARFSSALASLERAAMVEIRGDEIGFPHDRVREAILEATDRAIPPFAGMLSERLVRLPDTEWPEISAAALHLRQLGGLDDVETEPWRDRFAQGAVDARSRMDFESAIRLAEIALDLRERLRPADPVIDRKILRESILAAADRNDPEAVLDRTRRLLASCRDDLDLGEAYELAIAALRLSGDSGRAWTLAKEGMKRFNVDLPAEAGVASVLIAAMLWQVTRRLRGRQTDIAVNVATDAYTRVANATAGLAYEHSPRMAALVALKGSRRAYRAPRTAFWSSTDTFLCASTGDYTEAARLGSLAATVAGRPDHDGFARSATLYRALYWGPIWTQPAASLRGRCLEVRDLAMAEGDLVQAAIAIRNWIIIGWRTGVTLPNLTEEIREAERDVQRLGDVGVIEGIAAVRKAVAELSAMPEPSRTQPPQRAPESLSVWERVVALETASLRGDWAYAAEIVNRHAPFGRSLDSHPGGVVWRFLASLARLRTGRRARRADVAFIERAVRLNPSDHQGKLLLLKAEMLSHRAGPKACLPAYARAVAVAKSAASRLDAGLAAEGAARAARAAGEARLAEGFEQDAQSIWRIWGAVAKLAPQSDPTRQEDLATRLLDAQAQALAAERTDRAKSRLLADVAHELRTPMQTLQGLLDLAVDDPAAADLATVRDVFGGLKAVVNDLTDFGALSSGQAPAIQRPTAIIDLIGAECAAAAAFAAANGATLRFEVGDDVPADIETDGSRVAQVTRNLLSNAVKYGQGCEIRVGLARVKVPRPAGDQLSISVEDRGPGLSDADLLQLFEPFVRGARVGDGKGLGLGLTLSRRIAQHLGGALTAENRPGGGARFDFRFPLTPAASPPSQCATAPPLNILLADDTAPVRRVIAAILRRQGHEVVEAADGAVAAEALDGGGFDLAIIDLVMPRLGGVDLIARLRAGPAPLSALPIIILTASSDLAMHAGDALAGASLVLRKPVSARELGLALGSLFGRPVETEASADLDFDTEMRALAAAAQSELVRRAGDLLRTPDGVAVDPAEAHAIAGLAAQFGWSSIAEAADDFERRLRSDEPTAPARARLSSALAQSGVQDGLASTVTPN